MQAEERARGGNATLAAVVTFLVILVVLLVVALMNAPVMASQQTVRSLPNYLAEVRATGIPFLAAVGVAAAIIGVLAARTVRRVWPDQSRRRELLAGYAFLAPYLIITLIFTVGVVLFAFYIAFNDYGIYTRPEWVGLENFRRAFGQREFLQSLHNVLWYAAIVTPTQTAIAIALAVLLNAPMRFKQFFRTIFYAPSVTSSVVITLIFIWLYLRTGYVNLIFDRVLGIFGVEWQALNWLGDPRGLIQLIVGAFGVNIPSDQWYLRGPSIAWMALMVQNIFTTAPTFMIMFLAALQDINPTLYEAAAIDGATGWQRFWKVTLPLLRPIIVLVIVLGTIGTLQVFDQIYLATAGGPLGTTLTPVYVVYREALGTQGPIQMGYGSALAFILAAIIFVFTFLQRRFIERGAEMY
ncbi:MAG: sugar ABC transporter permease [Anaerolineae bacterium]|jgi:multiple sugar transport system permease protein|nr:sugar ABC transporter permease [Anaerolineae bacterium]MDX9832920.1 sugar ABC transporter permease [Anaerolineae bacterium]